MLALPPLPAAPVGSTGVSDVSEASSLLTNVSGTIQQDINVFGFFFFLELLCQSW